MPTNPTENQTSDAKPDTLPPGAVRVASGGWLKPIRKGDPAGRAIARLGGVANNKANKRLRRILKYSSKAYDVKPSAVATLLEHMMSKPKYKTFLATEFTELCILADDIFESKIASEMWRDEGGKMHHRSNSEGFRGAFELKLRFLELALKFSKVLHPDDFGKNNTMQAIQIVMPNGTTETVKILPLDTAQPSNPSAQPVDLLPNLTSEKSSPPVGADGEREVQLTPGSVADSLPRETPPGVEKMTKKPGDTYGTDRNDQ